MTESRIWRRFARLTFARLGRRRPGGGAAAPPGGLPLVLGVAGMAVNAAVAAGAAAMPTASVASGLLAWSGWLLVVAALSLVLLSQGAQDGNGRGWRRLLRPWRAWRLRRPRRATWRLRRPWGRRKS